MSTIYRSSMQDDTLPPAEVEDVLTQQVTDEGALVGKKLTDISIVRSP